MNIPSNSEVRTIMGYIFGEHTVEPWSMDELRQHVRTTNLDVFVDYPEYLDVLLHWLRTLRT